MYAFVARRVIECTDLALISPSHREVSHCHLRPSRGGRGDPRRREEEGREGRERQVRRRARIARRVPQARRAPGRRDAQIVTRRHAVRGARRAARGAREERLLAFALPVQPPTPSASCSQNTKMAMFSLISKVFGHV